MQDLRTALDGATKADGLAALDQAYVAFAKLDHSDELIGAIEKWIEFRLSQ